MSRNPVERALDEDRRRAARVVRHVRHGFRLVDRVGRRQPDQDALVEREDARAPDRLPDLIEGAYEEEPR